MDKESGFGYERNAKRKREDPDPEFLLIRDSLKRLEAANNGKLK